MTAIPVKWAIHSAAVGSVPVCWDVYDASGHYVCTVALMEGRNDIRDSD